MSADKTPSDEGKKRYPPDGYYEEVYPCTCRPDCPQACKGECRCGACGAAYGDAISELGCE